MRYIYAFLSCMWVLIIVGGGIVVTILGPVSITGFGDLNQAVSSAVKGVIAVLLVIAWVFALSRLKNWIFRTSTS